MSATSRRRARRSGSRRSRAARSWRSRRSRTSEEDRSHIRAATLDDADGIAVVHVGAWQVAYAHVFPEAELRDLSIESRAERWREILADPRPAEFTHVAVDDSDRILGFSTSGPARSESPEVGELRAIYVAPEIWGAGVGRMLMAATLTRLRASGFREAILWVLEDNPRTRRFYELAGWREDRGFQEEERLGTLVREVRYRIAFGA